MSHLPKGPSRFIPTLTEMVLESHSPSGFDISAKETPRARNLPETPCEPAASLSTQAAPLWPRQGFREAAEHDQRTLAPGFEEHLVHRVMQRVDVGLDQQLRDAIAMAITEQTRSLLPRLREEVESVVRHVVYEAVAEELAAGEKPEVPKS